MKARGAAKQTKPQKAQKASGQGRKLVAHLRGKGNSKLTTDEIMELTRGKR